MGFEFGEVETGTENGREEVIRRVKGENVMGTDGVVGHDVRWREEQELGEHHCPH